MLALAAMAHVQTVAIWGNIQVFSMIFGVHCQPPSILQKYFHSLLFLAFLGTIDLFAVYTRREEEGGGNAMQLERCRLDEKEVGCS